MLGVNSRHSVHELNGVIDGLVLTDGEHVIGNIVDASHLGTNVITPRNIGVHHAKDPLHGHP